MTEMPQVERASKLFLLQTKGEWSSIRTLECSSTPKKTYGKGILFTDQVIMLYNYKGQEIKELRQLTDCGTGV